MNEEMKINLCNAINESLEAEIAENIMAVPVDQYNNLVAFYQMYGDNQQALADIERISSLCSDCPRSANVKGHADSSDDTGSLQLTGDIVIGNDLPRPEHVHLARDTAQDILNAKRRNILK